MLLQNLSKHNKYLYISGYSNIKSKNANLTNVLYTTNSLKKFSKEIILVVFAPLNYIFRTKEEVSLIDHDLKLKKIMSDFQSNHRIDCNFIRTSETRKKKLLLADMDSTIIREESLDELAKQIGKEKEISFITN